ncbi:MAG: 50S ribosomal protein L32 [Deltaproteobacteria bacterium]|nr:50S ribosomal protein L32 [Deltaproteobacteria bacterium]
MAVPKKKKSRARRDRRRANHDRIDAPAISSCPECGAPLQPHRACPACGMYRGRQVIEIADDLEESGDKA